MGTLLSGQTLRRKEEILLVKGASLIKHRRAADTECSGKGLVCRICKHRIGLPCDKSPELRRGHFNPDQIQGGRNNA